MSECCWKTYQASKASKRIIDHIDHSLSDPYGLAHQDVRHQPLATRIWLSLDRPRHSYRAKVRLGQTAPLLQGQDTSGSDYSIPTRQRYVWVRPFHSYKAKVRLGQTTPLLQGHGMPGSDHSIPTGPWYVWVREKYGECGGDGGGNTRGESRGGMRKGQ